MENSPMSLRDVLLFNDPLLDDLYHKRISFKELVWERSKIIDDEAVEFLQRMLHDGLGVDEAASVMETFTKGLNEMRHAASTSYRRGFLDGLRLALMAAARED